MAAKKEPVISVELEPGYFVYLNYYQISTVVVARTTEEDIVGATFSMNNGGSWKFKNDIAAWAFSQYQKIVNKEND